MGWRGTVGVRGRRQYVHVGLVAACSCAQSCAQGKTGVGRPAKPARGMPRAHAAHTPQTHSAPPSTGSRGCWWVPTVGRHICQILIFIMKSGSVPTNGRHPPEQSAAPTDRRKLSEVGRCRIAGCQRHGCRCQAYRDVLAASPHSDTAPPTHRKPAFDVDVDVSRCRAASPAKNLTYSGGVSRTRWMSVGVDSGMSRSARICSRLKYRSLRVPYTCLGLAT